MKAQIIESFGSPEVFQLKEIPKPELQLGHVLLQVKASSVNPIDTKVRAGLVQAAPDFPAVLHGDVAGVVVTVGEGVTKFQVGDEVFGCAGGFKNMTGGALAEFMLADVNLLAHKPKNISMEEAAAIPLVALTAWEALFNRGRLQAGENILIHAATGGVGHVAIQLAKWAGAEVYTTASTKEKQEIGAGLGADVTINYREVSVQDYVQKYTKGKGFDLVFDTVGGENLDRSFEAVKIHGTVLTIAARSTHDLSPLHSKGLSLHVTFLLPKMMNKETRKEYGDILEKVAAIIEEGKLRPLIDSNIFSFDEVAKAHEYLESGKHVGKIVLVNKW